MTAPTRPRTGPGQPLPADAEARLASFTELLATAIANTEGRADLAASRAHVERRLPAPIEVAAYYVVSEAFTNAAKHAQASVVQVELDTRDAVLRLAVRDDGIGGADPGRGSGLVGLRDRIEALGGTLEVASPTGKGTMLLAEIPLEDHSSVMSPEP